MKEIKCFTFKETTTADNKVEVLKYDNQEYEIKILENDQKTEIKEFDHITGDKKVVIIIKFEWKTDWSGIGENKVNYLLRKTDIWQATPSGGAKIKKGKKPEFEKMKKEAHKKLLKEKFSDKLFGTDKREEMKGSNNIQVGITEREGGKEVVVNFYKKDEPNQTISFTEEKVDIKVKYYQPKEITSEEGGEEIEEGEEKKEFKWTAGWITFFVILTLIVVLIFIFRKKIWRWIKGEREQEKKVREQIDIF